MASKYSVTYNGLGYGEGRSTKSFSTLEAAAEYVKDRFDVDYQDGEAEFHNDYGVFTLRGFTLAEIGLGWSALKADTRSIGELVEAGRFVVVLGIPEYDNRDAHCATSYRVHSHYETREEAEIAVDVAVLRDEFADDISVTIRPSKPYVQPEGYSSFNESEIPF